MACMERKHAMEYVFDKPHTRHCQSEFRPSFHPLCLLCSLSMFLQLPSLWACLGLWRGCVWPSHLTPPSGACWSSKHTHWNVQPWIGSAGGRKLHFSRWTPSGWCSSAWLHCGELHGCSHSTLLAYQLWRKRQSPAFHPLMWRKWVQDFVPISSGIILNKTDFFPLHYKKTVQSTMIRNEGAMIYGPLCRGDLILPSAQWPIHCVSRVNTNNEM